MAVSYSLHSTILLFKFSFSPHRVVKKVIAFIANHKGYMGWCKERTLLSSTVTSGFGNSVDKNEMQQEMKLFEDATEKKCEGQASIHQNS